MNRLEKQKVQLGDDGELIYPADERKAKGKIPRWQVGFRVLLLSIDLTLIGVAVGIGLIRLLLSINNQPTPQQNFVFTASAPRRIVAPTITPLPTSTEPPPKSLGKTERLDRRGIPQVLVTEGCFMMGGPASVPELNTEPVQICLTHPYWIDKYEVTNESFQKFISDSGYGISPYPKNYPNFDGPKQPRVSVTWVDAQAYAHWRGGSLPTEAEWEYAARGPSSSTFPWGNAWRIGYANTVESGPGHSTTVGQYYNDVSWCQAQDMAGNVQEWVKDWYNPVPLRTAKRYDPQGPEVGEGKVAKGGSWAMDQNSARNFNRSGFGAEDRHYYLGFRIVTHGGE